MLKRFLDSALYVNNWTFNTRRLVRDTQVNYSRKDREKERTEKTTDNMNTKYQGMDWQNSG